MTVALRWSPVLAVVVGLTLPTAGAAQSRVSWGVAALGSVAGIVRETSAGATELNGVLFGGEALVRFWRAELGGRYLQGSVNAEGGSEGTDLVEGELMLGLQPLEMLRLRAGPHARAFVTDRGTERWVFWEVRARLETPILPQRLSSFLEGWVALSGQFNAPQPFGGGRGLEGGLVVRIPRTILWTRLSYRVDRGALEGDARIDSAAELLLRVGIGQ